MDTLKISIVSLLVAFIIVWLVMPRVLPILHRLHFGQAIREEGPQSHMKKSGTPTMGGLVIQGAVLIAVIIISLFTKKWDFFPLIVMVAFGGIGFIDDFIKVSKKHNLGLRAWPLPSTRHGHPPSAQSWSFRLWAPPLISVSGMFLLPFSQSWQ